LLPDIVFLLRLDPAAGLTRSGQHGTDRIEEAGIGFHEQVGEAYLELARRYPARFVPLDADRSPAELHKKVVSAFQERARDRLASPPRADLGPVAPPVPR
jgi:thymidylate kinase